MCQIITYGFRLGGNILTGPTCSGLTTDSIGARISISIDAVDIGVPMVGSVILVFNGAQIGSFASNTYTPSGTGLWTFDIPFTGVTPQVGTYTFLDGCAYVSPLQCYSCSTTGCTSLTLSSPCSNPTCNFQVV